MTCADPRGTADLRDLVVPPTSTADLPGPGTRVSGHPGGRDDGGSRVAPGTDTTENGLRHLLNEWDPLGVADEVQDEYDCMLAPLLQRPRRGANQAEIGEFLRYELEDHFGLAALPSEPEAMDARLMSWWTAAGTADGTGCV